MENELTLKTMLSLFLNRIWLILTIMIMSGVAAFSYAKFALPLQYQSYTSLYVRNSTDARPNDSVNLGDINASKSLVSTYIAVLQDDAVMDAIGQKMLENYSVDQLDDYFQVITTSEKTSIAPASIRKCLTLASVDQTEVMKVTAITGSAELSAALCNTVATVAPDFLIRVVGAGSVEAIGPARLNASPVAPNIPKSALIGAFIGFLVVYGILFLLFVLDNTVKDGEAISTKLHSPVIGEIVDFDLAAGRKKAKKDSHADGERYLISNDNVPFHIVESYKTLRSNLLFSLATASNKIIAVSSANPMEGKSITTANLALTMAQLGKKVLLIDADMRKPMQHKIFALKNSNGLSNVLAKLCQPSDCIYHDVHPQLDVMPCGTLPPNPSELLGSEQMAEMLKKLAESYEYILIDTPPVNVVSDALCLSPMIAGIVMVLRYGKTTIDDTNKVIEKLNLSNANLLGFTLNGIDLKNRSPYYRKKYKYGSKYSSKYSYNYSYSDAPEAKSDLAQTKSKKQSSPSKKG